MRHVSLIALVVACAGCASWFDEIDYFHMPPRFEYEGFSFDRPPGPEWFMRRSQQSHTLVMLWREPSKPSATHSFFAQISLASLSAQPASAEEFAKLAESPPRDRVSGASASRPRAWSSGRRRRPTKSCC